MHTITNAYANLHGLPLLFTLLITALILTAAAGRLYYAHKQSVQEITTQTAAFTSKVKQNREDRKQNKKNKNTADENKDDKTKKDTNNKNKKQPPEQQKALEEIKLNVLKDIALEAGLHVAAILLGGAVLISILVLLWT